MTTNNHTQQLNTWKQIFGAQAVFLPIPEGQKGPRLKDWPNITKENMQDPNYLRYFEIEGNAGILLGTENEDQTYTVCLDFDTDPSYHQFCTLNPDLITSATVRGAKGAKVFFRITTLPENGKIRDEHGTEIGDILASGRQAVIHGRHPSGCHYEWISREPPMTVELERIEFPEGWSFPWTTPLIDQLRNNHGVEYEESRSGALKLNQNFFAGMTLALNEFRYSTVERCFYSYSEEAGLWMSEPDEVIKGAIDTTLVNYANQVDEGLRQRIMPKRTDAFLSASLNLLKMLAACPDEFRACKEGLIHLKNGVYDLAKRRLRPFSKEDLLTTGIPFEFNEHAKCPAFLGFIQGALDDDALIFQKLLGSYLMGVNDAQVIWIIYGEAGSGKSTLIQIIQSVLGVNNIALLRPKYLDSRFELAQLRKARLLVGPDVRRDFLNDANAQSLKALTGGDPLTCELKGFNEPFEINGNFNVVVTGNGRPKIQIESDRDAWTRRLIVTNVRGARPAKPIPKYAEKLIAAEGAGIIQWAIAGAHLYMEDLNNHGKIQRSDAQQRAVNDLLLESESLETFVRQYIGREKGSSLTVQSIQEVYAEFCAHKSWSPIPEREFSKRLPDLMQEHHYVTESHSVSGRSGQARGYRNVSLSPLLAELPGFAA